MDQKYLITVIMACALLLPSCLLTGQDAQPISSQDATTSPDKDSEENPVNSATVQGLDGTKINLLINSSGQAVTVATQDPPTIKSKKRKHTLIGNPVDEPLSTGLINISSLTLVEDAQPELSNPIP